MLMDRDRGDGMARFAGALRDIKADGGYRAILHRYGMRLPAGSGK